MIGDTTIALPAGVVTFLITDIERSTEILQALGDEHFSATIARHNEILRREIDGAGGLVVHVTGDSFFAVFTDPLEAVHAATATQRALAAEAWPAHGQIKVRMGLHTGVGRLGGEDYVGLDVHRAARISAAAHGGQVLLSGETARRVTNRLPKEVTLRDLGRHNLKSLSTPEQLFQIVGPDLPDQFEGIQALRGAPGSLPGVATTFVGRSQQIAEISALVRANRLVTLTGPGGTGKTRLSIQVARTLQHDFADGVFFVDLEAITDETLVPATVLKTLERPPNPTLDAEAQLLQFLSERTLLLVLDNYEQLLPSVSVVTNLLAAGDGVRIIVTSRAPLRITGEQEYQVPPLLSPTMARDPDPARLLEVESVELFVDRATSLRPDFRLTAENAEAVATLVERLDGLPLAIELAASRIRILTPQEILDRLSIRLLSTTSTDLPHRQRTIANAVEWSHDLLDQTQQSFFARLAVFMGGAALDQIEAVCDPEGELGVDALEALTDLVEQSLVEAVPGLWETRYQMLVVVREFAAEKLAATQEHELIRDRHLAAYVDLASRAEPFLLTSHQAKWLDILAREHDNLRSAHDWAVETEQTDVARALVGDLWRFWQRRGHIAEGLQRVETSLAMEDRSEMARARALEALGGLLYWKGDWESAGAVYLEALDLARNHGSPPELATALYNASFAMNSGGDPAAATALLEEAKEIWEAEGDRVGVGRALWGLCDVNFLDGTLEVSIEYGKRAESAFETLDAPFDLGWARFMIAHASYLRGDAASARRYIDTAIPLFVEADDISALTLVIYVKAAVLAAEGDEITALRLIGALDNIVRTTGLGIGQLEVNRYDDIRRLIATEDPAQIAILEEGRALSSDEVVELVIAT